MRNIQPENPIRPLLNERSELRQTQSRLLKEFETAFADYSQSNDYIALFNKAVEINYDTSAPNLINTSKKIAELNNRIAEMTKEPSVVYDNYQIKTNLYNGILAIISAFKQTEPALTVTFTKDGVNLILEAANLSIKQLEILSESEPRSNFANEGEYFVRNLTTELKPLFKSLPEEVKKIVSEVLPELFTAE